MKFLKGLLVLFLIVIIIGGVGYIGYSFLFMNHSGNQHSANADKNTTQAQVDIQQGTANDQSQQSGKNDQTAVSQANIILQNKENLDKAVASINESLRLMTVDPYAPVQNNVANMAPMNNQQTQQDNMQIGNTPAVATQGNIPAANSQGNNTTINIYPQNNPNTQQNNASQNNTVMQNMGTTYDPNKMEQLHTGLYKIYVGTALLKQLEDELVNQAENANANLQNTAQYYSNQYNLAVQNKNKLNQALTYVNEAANLININPYVSSNGLVYDRDRMNQIHQSILKLAEGVASLNLLSDNLIRQTILLSNMAQSYINIANTATASQDPMQMNHAAMSTGLLGGLFDNISVTTIVNFILIIFVIGLLAGIFGAVLSLLKPSAPKVERKESNVI